MRFFFAYHIVRQRCTVSFDTQLRASFSIFILCRFYAEKFFSPLCPRSDQASQVCDRMWDLAAWRPANPCTICSPCRSPWARVCELKSHCEESAARPGSRTLRLSVRTRPSDSGEIHLWSNESNYHNISFFFLALNWLREYDTEIRKCIR